MNLLRSLKRFSTAKRPFRLTRGGWVFILYTIGIGAGAINTGNNLIYLVFGLFLGLIMASGVLSDLSLWGLSADLRLPVSGETKCPLTIPVRIKNSNRWFPAISLQVELIAEHRGQRIRLRLFVPSLSSGREIASHFMWTPPSRGAFNVTSLKFLTQFPFGLLTKWWTYMDAPTKTRSLDQMSFLVYPEINRTLEPFHAPASGKDDYSAAEEKGDGTTLYGLREFQETDNPKRIHWKVSAKRGSLTPSGDVGWLVKEMERDHQPALVMRWPDWSEVGRLADFERFVSLTASLCAGAQSQSSDVRLIVPMNGDEYDVSGNGGSRAQSILEFLSLVEPGDSINDAAGIYLRRLNPAEEATPASLDVGAVFRRQKEAS